METQTTRKKKRKKKDILETFATTKCNEERHTLKQNCRIHHIVVLHNKQEEPNTTRKKGKWMQNCKSQEYNEHKLMVGVEIKSITPTTNKSQNRANNIKWW